GRSRSVGNQQKGRADMSTRTEQYFTQQEAAELAGKSLDTIKRRRKDGKLPNARQRDDVHRTWEIPYSDLVTAGLVDAGAHSARDIDEQLGLSRTPRRIAELTTELEVARTEV